MVIKQAELHLMSIFQFHKFGVGPTVRDRVTRDITQNFASTIATKHSLTDEKNGFGSVLTNR
jgi:hypothetical protein